MPDQRVHSLDEVLDHFGVTRQELEAEPDPVEHHVELIEGLAVEGMWSGICKGCGRIVGDNASKQATQLEAEEHERNPDPPELEPWHPGKHPTPDR